MTTIDCRWCKRKDFDSLNELDIHNETCRNPFDVRVDAFCEELTELCVKHGVMVQGGGMYATLHTSSGPGKLVLTHFPDHSTHLVWRDPE